MGWYMKIHEYQAKDLLAAEGAKIPVGIIANSPEEAIKAFDQLGGKPVVLKAQVHAGGRGKGRFKDSGKDFGGVKFITKREDIIPIAEVMFKSDKKYQPVCSSCFVNCVILFLSLRMRSNS